MTSLDRTRSGHVVRPRIRLPVARTTAVSRLILQQTPLELADFVPLHGEVLEALHAYGMHMSGQNDEQVGDEQVGEDLVDAQQQQT
jgi:hypothetical protein